MERKAFGSGFLHIRQQHRIFVYVSSTGKAKRTERAGASWNSCRGSSARLSTVTSTHNSEGRRRAARRAWRLGWRHQQRRSQSAVGVWNQRDKPLPHSITISGCIQSLNRWAARMEAFWADSKSAFTRQVRFIKDDLASSRGCDFHCCF